MNLQVKKFSADNEETGTLVVFATPGKKSVSVAGAEKEVSLLVSEAHTNEAFAAGVKEALFFRNSYVGGFKHLLVVGLGESKEITNETLRQAGAVVYGQLKAAKVKDSTVHVDSLVKYAKPATDGLQAFTEGLLLAEYNYDDFKAQKATSIGDITIGCGTAVTTVRGKSVVDVAVITAEGTNLTRSLGDAPGNKMTPTLLAKATMNAAKGTKLKITVLTKAQIQKEKMGGLLGVAQGSDEDPRFIMMEYKGAAASKKPLCLVGKGLTFDSGGISIKPGAGMHEMKYDMQGGASVIGAMIAIAKLKLKVNVIAFVPSSENMSGGSALKPGDVITSRAGKTVEVLNTDAEGRLILMDALSYASDKKPAAIIDLATLTGAMVVALGNSHTGIYGNDDKLIQKVEAAADRSGERVWHMPLVSDHHDDMKGTHADLSNLSSTRGAGSATAAAFLENFVGEGIPWVHCDIAGTGWNCGNRLNYCPAKGASGAMVRTLVEVAKKF